MEYSEDISVDRFYAFASFLAKFSFFVYIFLLIFGTRIPFQDYLSTGELRRVEDIGTSNIVNQIVFSSLYILSLIGLIATRKQVLLFIKNEKILSLFLLWALLSVLWSAFPLVSFKRWVRLFGGVIILVSALMHFDSTEEVLKYFKVILVSYILITFLAILFIPAATDYRFPAWRGISVHKNHLGQISLISLILWSIELVNTGFAKRAIAVIFWCLSFVLLIGSKSTTAILAGAILLCTLGSFYITKKVFQPVVGKFISYLFLISFVGCSLIIAFLGWEQIESLVSLFGKDLTFTGRTYLWVEIFKETKDHLLLGFGYGGFWIPMTPIMDQLYDEFTWFPNQAHSGYLDVLNETGVVGLTLLTLMIVVYFSNVGKLNVLSSNLKWFVIAALILNITESSFFLPGVITWDLFLLSYLAFHTEFLKSGEEYQLEPSGPET
jgi:O-antigen ligase